MIGIPISQMALGSDHGPPKENLFQCRCWLNGLLGVLRCYGTLCEEVGSHLVGVDRMQRNFEPRKKQVEAWKGTRLPDETAFRQGVMELLKRCGCIFQPDWPSRKTHSAVLLSNFDR